MNRNFRTQSPLPALLIAVGATLGLLAFALLSGQIEVAKASPAELPPAQQPDNSACLACHGQPGQTMTFANGDAVSIEVKPEVYSSSMHQTLSCQVCHPNISGFPHPENVAQTAKEYTLQYKETCKTCHPSEAEQAQDSAHTRLLNEGNTNAPICADCHKPHEQQAIEKGPDGLPASSEHANIALVCAQCHSAIYNEYIESVHGTGIIENRNPDVPACTDCHGIHTITGPTYTNFRLTSPQICSRCHTDETIMSKYGLSTDVLRTYISDFHGTTVTLFEKTDPDQQTNKPVCYDCHGVHNILPVDDPQKGLSIKENLLVTCKRCHPDATINFPDSWLSHYIPSPEKYPLVYYVQLFYYILIPTVLGAMAIFVLSDAYRRIFIDRKKKASQPVVEPPPVETSTTESKEEE
jgi:predicted CXXCH cytochrome family protein